MRNFLCVTYDPLGGQFISTIEFCDGYKRLKTKACAVSKKIQTRAENLGERIFVDTTGPLLESLIGYHYYIGVVD